MENLEEKEALERISAWLSGPKDYSAGRDLLKTIPGCYNIYLQLREEENYPDLMRMCKAMANARDMFRD